MAVATCTGDAAGMESIQAEVAVENRVDRGILTESDSKLLPDPHELSFDSTDLRWQLPRFL